jgi:hypothetical protein
MSGWKLDEVAKIGAVGLGFSYAVGIVVWNAYLATVGVMDFDVVRPRAVLTGIIYVLFATIATIADDAISRALGLKDIPLSWRLGNVLFALSGAILAYFILLSLAHPVGLWRILRTSFLMFVGIGSAIAAARNAMREWLRRVSDQKVGPTFVPFFAAHCLIGAIAILLFTALFISEFFRFVPQQFGGGKPLSAEIAVSDAEVSILHAMAVPTNGNVIVGPIVVLDETSTSVMLRSVDGHTVVLPRNEILAMRID